MDMSSTILTILLFIFGILLSAIGWLIVDKLRSITEVLKKIGDRLEAGDKRFANHDKRISILEEKGKSK